MAKFQMPVIATTTQDDPTIDELNAELREQAEADFLDLDGELADAIEAMMLAEDEAFLSGVLNPPRDMTYLRRKFPLSEFCTDVPRKHQRMAPQPCTLIGPDPLPKKRKILVSR